MESYSYSYQSSSPIPGIISLVLIVLVIAGMWKIFSKAGVPGWHSLIPFLNVYDLCKISLSESVGLFTVLSILIPFVLIYPCIGSELPVLEDGVLKTKVFRCDQAVDGDTPPAFLISSYEDHLVCCNQALNMALSCSNHDVPFELHCYTPGEHGILANELIGTTDTGFRKQGFDTWLPDCLAWLRDLFRFPPRPRLPWEPPAPEEKPKYDPLNSPPRKHEDYYPAFSLPPMPGAPGRSGFSGNTPMAEVLADPRAAEIVYGAVPWLREVRLDDSVKGMTINQCLAFADLDERPFGPPPDPKGPMAKLREILG